MKTMNNRTNILLLCLALLTTWCFAACDETLEGTTDGVVFPAETTIFASPGETVAISFDVAYNWKVTSNKEWCLVAGEKTKYTSGKPGAHIVEYVIGNPENLYADDVASVTMHMEGQDSVIARIVCRATKEYEIVVSDENGAYANGNSIVIGTSGQLELNLYTPFNIEELEYKFPTEWLEVQIDDATMKLNVKEDLLKYAVNNENDSLCLFKSDAFRSSFHVQYEGMNPRVILVEGRLEEPLIVSRDAMRAYMTDLNGERKEMPIRFTVTSLNDKYQVLSLGYDNINGYSILTDEERWFELVDNNQGNLSLSVTETNEGKDRSAALFVFPEIIADSLANIGFEGIETFLYEEVGGVKTLKEEAKQYLLTQMTQYGSTDITIGPEARWGLKVAVDGKTYTTPTLTDTLDAPLKAKITTDNGYQLVHVSYDNERGCVIIPETDSWLDVIDNKQDSIEIRFQRNVGNMRTAYLLALPTVIAEDKDNLASELFTVTEGQVDGPLEIRDDAVKYVVAQFIQDAEEESSLKVIDANLGWKYLTVENETEDKWLGIAAAKGISPKKVFRADLKTGVSYLLNPLLAKDVWNPGIESQDGLPIDRIEVYGESGVKYVHGKTDGCHYEAEPTMMEEEEGEYMLVQFKARYELEEEYYIIYFITADDVYLKALVVYNYWE